MFHGGGWFGFLGASNEKPKVTRNLVRRVLGYARPYWARIGLMLVMILISTGLTLVNPLILRKLIDQTIPSKNIQQLVLLAFALLLIPIINGAVGVVQRRLNANVGE
jgi:ATP-binding cassette subfamily B protein